MDAKVPVSEVVAGSRPSKKAWSPPRLTVHGALPAMTLAATGPAPPK
jgi:hypothetical protein